MGTWSNKFEVLPGRHTLGVIVPTTGFNFEKRNPIPMSFHAEAGHTYVVRGKNEGVQPFGIGGTPEAWIEDSTSGDTVAGRHPDS